MYLDTENSMFIEESPEINLLDSNQIFPLIKNF